MWELLTIKTNFLFKTSQDFNQTTHAGPHLPIVFIDNIILYFNYLVFVLHIFKRSCNAHIPLFFSHFTVYAYQTSEIFLKKNHLNYSFKKTHHFKDELTRPIINTSFFTMLKNVAMFKIIEFY